jgi:adenylate cyclase
MAEKALGLDEENTTALSALALALVHLDKHAAALRAAQRAVELNASSSLAHVNLAACSLLSGQAHEALKSIDTALRLSPLDPQKFSRMALRASALFLLKRYDEAARCAEQSRAIQRFHTASRVLAASYAQLGQMDKARDAVNELLSMRKGDTSISEVTSLFLNVEDREHYAEALRKAGLPET